MKIVGTFLRGDAADKVKVRQSPTRITFSFGDDLSVKSNLVEGTFPPYQDVISKDQTTRLTLARLDLISAMKRAALLTTDESPSVKLAITKNGLALSGRSPEAGEGRVNLACKVEGKDLNIGFNPYFVLDGLTACDDDEVVLELSAPNRPGLLKAGRFSYTIMPVNLQH